MNDISEGWGGGGGGERDRTQDAGKPGTLRNETEPEPEVIDARY